MIYRVQCQKSDGSWRIWKDLNKLDEAVAELRFIERVQPAIEHDHRIDIIRKSQVHELPI